MIIHGEHLIPLNVLFCVTSLELCKVATSERTVKLQLMAVMRVGGQKKGWGKGWVSPEHMKGTQAEGQVR